MTKNQKNTFGRFVRRCREEKGLGLRELAARVPMSPAYLSKIERGQFKPPGEEKIKKLAELLVLDPDTLLARAGRVSSDLPEAIRQDVGKWAEMLRHTEELDPKLKREFLEVWVSFTRKVKVNPLAVSRMRDWLASRDSD